MAPHLFLSFILISRLWGADCVVKVPVQRGGSVTIPCSYDQEYVHHVKYICKGVTQVWGFCSCFIRSDSRKTDQASVSDDAIQRVFTVTLTEMDLKDSGNYWCAVEIDWGRDYEGTHYQLSVSPGTPQLYVEQQNFMGLDGGSVTVQCYYSNSGPMKWCRMGSSCVEKYFGTLHGATVALQRILDNTDRKVMIVTMSELHPGNSGWHLCSIGDLQIPVHVTVMSRSSPQSKTLPSQTTCETTSLSVESTTTNFTSHSSAVITSHGPQRFGLLLLVPKTAVLVLLCIIFAVVNSMEEPS